MPTAAPPSVRRAVIAMYIGAGTSIVGLAVGVAMLNWVKNKVMTSLTRPQNMTAQDYVNFRHAISTIITDVGLPVIVISGLIGAGIWLWMAWKCNQGRGWARVVSTVLFGINCLGLIPVTGNGVRSISLLLLAWHLISWLPALAAIIFLWNRESTAYFQAPRY
jgi:hypothetical protein